MNLYLHFAFHNTSCIFFHIDYNDTSTLHCDFALFFPLDVIVTFYHVTPEKNLKSIAEKGLQPSSRGEGISALKGETFFMEDSKGKVFLTNQWFTVKRYAEHFQTLLEKKERKETVEPQMFPSVLKVDLTLEQRKGAIFKDETDQPPLGKDGKPIPVPGGSYYLTKRVPTSQIAIALHVYPADKRLYKQYQENPSWKWVPVTELTFSGDQIKKADQRMMPIIPDLPKEGLNTNAVFPTAKEVMKWYLPPST